MEEEKKEQKIHVHLHGDKVSPKTPKYKRIELSTNSNKSFMG